MFAMVRTLFGKRTRPEILGRTDFARQSGQRIDQLDRVAPLKQELGVDENQHERNSCICREAVLNRHERIAGYEFSLHRRLKSRFMDERVLARRLYDDLLVRSLASLSVSELVGRRLAFVDVSPAILLNPELERLPVGNTVIMLDVPASTEMDPMQLTVQIEALRERGFRVGWRLRQGATKLGPILAACDYIQVLTGEFDGLELADLASQVRAHERPGRDELLLIASDVATFDDFQLCYRAGFDYFQGPFITSRDNWHPPKSDIDRTKVIQILNRLRAGAQTMELAEALRRDPVLTYKMLRYINAPAMGLRKQITEIEQALVVLGQDKLYRWLSLLLFEVKGAGYAEHSLFEQALVRARLMEQLGLHTGLPVGLTEQLFLTGLFSLLPEMLGQAIAQILAKVAVTDTVRLALLENKGPFAPFLELSIACEVDGNEEIERLASLCDLEPETVNLEMVRALNWANEVGELAR